jgi:AcrR family transcriptional regulator
MEQAVSGLTNRVSGRPRRPGLSDAALTAAIDLIVEEGYRHLTMERVAERASASRTALYRRWPNKLDLAVDAISSFADTHIPLPDTGRMADDIVAFLRALVRARAQVETYTALSSALVANPELGERCRDVLHESFSSSFRTIVERGIERGELPPETDVELYAEVAPALIRYRVQRSGSRLDEQLIERIARQFFSPPSRRSRARSSEQPRTSREAGAAL